MKVKLGTGMPPSLARGGKKKTTGKKKKNTKNSEHFFQSEGQRKLQRLNDFVSEKTERERGRTRREKQARCD